MAKFTAEQVAEFELDAQHECMEVIVAQTNFVSIWGHSAHGIEKKVFSVEVYELPEGFYSMIDLEAFQTRTPVEGSESAYHVHTNFGEKVREDWFDDFSEAMAVLQEIIAQHRDRIHEHS